MSADDQKKQAGEAAMEYVADGMIIGIGTGSTADHFTRALGAKVAEGWQVRGVPTSEKTAELAESLNIPLVTLDEVSQIDVTVDGADEIDEALRLIKGGGGALLREKIVASASRKIVTIADESKLVATLGAFALPVEIVDFAPGRALMEIARIAEKLGCAGHSVDLRDDQWGEPFVTDGGHFVADCACGAIPDPEGLSAALIALPQVVDHGLFIGLSSVAILGTDSGVRTITAA